MHHIVRLNPLSKSKKDRNLKKCAGFLVFLWVISLHAEAQFPIVNVVITAESEDAPAPKTPTCLLLYKSSFAQGFTPAGLQNAPTLTASMRGYCEAAAVLSRVGVTKINGQPIPPRSIPYDACPTDKFVSERVGDILCKQHDQMTIADDNLNTKLDAATNRINALENQVKALEAIIRKNSP